MPVSAATVQNVTGGGASIVALDNPPEGRSGSSVTFTFEPGGPVTLLQTFQMNSAQGLPMSQVVSLAIDNTQNQSPINVSHGVFGELVTIPAFTFQIIPTFSNKGPFPIAVTLAPGSAPVAVGGVEVDVIFLNYSRPSASFSGTGVSGNSVQNVVGTTLNSGLGSITSAGVIVGSAIGTDIVDSFWLYELDFNLISLTALGAGAVIVSGQVEALGNSGRWSFSYIASAGAAGLMSINKTWQWNYNPTPMYLQPSNNIQGQFIIAVTAFTNLSSFNYQYAVSLQQISANPGPTGLIG